MYNIFGNNGQTIHGNGINCLKDKPTTLKSSMLIILTVRPINPLNTGLIFLSSLSLYICVYM